MLLLLSILGSGEFSSFHAGWLITSNGGSISSSDSLVIRVHFCFSLQQEFFLFCFFCIFYVLYLPVNLLCVGHFSRIFFTILCMNLVKLINGLVHRFKFDCQFFNKVLSVFLDRLLRNLRFACTLPLFKLLFRAYKVNIIDWIDNLTNISRILILLLNFSFKILVQYVDLTINGLIFCLNLLSFSFFFVEFLF